MRQAIPSTETLPATLPAMKSKRHYDAGESSEWYTPAEYVAAARATMGGIDAARAAAVKGDACKGYALH